LSPRSQELLEAAREALRGAELALPEAPARAASSAYYAMLFVARAALSELDENARTHRGTWHLFHQRFVASGRIPEELHRAAQEAQELREAGDYAARLPSPGEARATVEDAQRFLAAVSVLLQD
jgi:uncharacterized protein (UPF0332 family)